MEHSDIDITGMKDMYMDLALEGSIMGVPSRTRRSCYGACSSRMRTRFVSDIICDQACPVVVRGRSRVPGHTTVTKVSGGKPQPPGRRQLAYNYHGTRSI